jgi:hypothetical protein
MSRAQPSWLSDLRADPAVAALGIDWLPPEQWAEVEDLSYPAWTGTPTTRPSRYAT